MRLNKIYATKNRCYKLAKKMTPKGIMVHSTAANNPYLRRYVQPDDGTLGNNPYGNSFNSDTPGGRKVCVHAFIGKRKDGTIATYQIMPWEWVAWHSGGGSKGFAYNMGYIGFEICEDGLTDPVYFQKVYREAVELTAYLCKKYNLDPRKDGVVICHSEGHKRGIASNHVDVMHWFPKHGKTMDTFRADVAAELGKTQKPAQSSYRVRVTDDNLNIRRGPGTNYSVVGQIKDKGIYTITETRSRWGRLKSGAGWISLKYTEKI